MRPEHAPQGNGVYCSKCGLATYRHRQRKRIRERQEYDHAYEKTRPSREHRFQPNRKQLKTTNRIIGVDGEGQGRFPHHYTYLAAADERGHHWSVGDSRHPLSSVECLSFLLDLPVRSLVVAFAFQYDLTKILKDLPNTKLYLLYHEKKRAFRDEKGKIRYRGVKWKDFRLDYMNGRLTVAKGARRVTVWDIWRFFQGKFTSALSNWKIGTSEEIEAIARMKEQRAHFDRLKPRQIQAYCQSECTKLAQLTRKLIDAHEDAGLKLKAFFGAGSTASALLSKLEIKQYLVKPPDPMTIPVACGFFGGRFENSIVGPLEQKVYNYDISSAYPYQITLLPCLMHGRWHHVSNPRIGVIERSNLALVRWRLRDCHHPTAWAPFPVRSSDGTIAFPKVAPGGWCWKQEYLAGQRLFPNVTCTEAWLYHTTCGCQPFKDIPRYYLERCRLGKGGAGDVYKLGPNSVYGKLAQSKGFHPPFQSFVYAGNITSGCRAQLLSAFQPGEDLWHVLMMATDSITSTRKLNMPLPVDTGTAVTGKPLGGWEEKILSNGIFAVRPGIWFPLQPTDDDLKEVRARGLGKKILYEQWPRILDQWTKTKYHEKLTVTGRHAELCKCGKCPEGLMRFVGAKGALSLGPKTRKVKRSKNYGEWVPHSIQVSFSPMPKRQAVMTDHRLKVWDSIDHESEPYDRALPDPDGEAIELTKDLIEEQPDLDLHFWP